MSDTQSAPCGVGGFGLVHISIDHHKIPDELRGDVARLLDRLGIANDYIDALRARVAELERELEQAKDDRNRAAMDARNPLMARLAELEARCKRLEEAGDALLGGVPASFKCAWRAAKEAKP